MKLAELRALEKLFAAEIDNRLPFQSKARIYTELEEQGYVQRLDRIFGSGALAVKISGWALTWRGHITYCEWADRTYQEESK